MFLSVVVLSSVGLFQSVRNKFKKFAVVVKMYQDTENPWQHFAREVGGKYRISEEGTSEVIGAYGKFPFILKIIFIQAAPKVNLFLTHLEINLDNKIGLKWKIYREGIIQKLTKLFGTQDIIFNDRSFDKKYIIEGSNEAQVKAIISLDIRAKIIELGEILMILDGNTLNYEQHGKIINTKKLFMILELLAELGEKIESHTPDNL